MSHNSDNALLPPHAGQQEFVESWLTGSQRKTAFALRRNCEVMIAGHDRRKLVETKLASGEVCKNWQIDGDAECLNCTGFLTLTVGDLVEGKFQQVFDASEASRRINNLNRRLLGDLFERAIVVTERHTNGAIHFHVLGVLRGRLDIRTGFDFAAVRRRDYRSASSALRGIWAMLREKLPRYGFGRAELTPIEKTGEAVACYISKYIEKNVCNRRADDKRKKLVRYVGWEKSQLKPNDFSWGTPNACRWRQNARGAASLVGVVEKDVWADLVGPRWGFFVTQKFQAFSKDFWRLEFGEREVLRAEVVREIGEYTARRRDERRLRLAEEIRELNASWESGEFKPRAPLPAVPAGISVRWPGAGLPCRRPRLKIPWKIGKSTRAGKMVFENPAFLTPAAS